MENLEILRESLAHHTSIMLHITTIIHGKNFIIVLPHAECGDLHMLLYGTSTEGHPKQFSDAVDGTFQRDQHQIVNDLLEQSRRIANALQWLHYRFEISGDKDVYCAHMDLKPENILIIYSETSVVGMWKLSDFGLSVFDQKGRRKPRLKAVGDLPSYLSERSDGSMKIGAQRASGAYQAPEVQRGEPAIVGRRSDVWSLACIYSEVVSFALGRAVSVRTFNDSRRFGNANDFFYSRQTVEPGQSVTVSFIVRPAVVSWLDKLVFNNNSPQNWVNCSTCIVKKYLVLKSVRPDSEAFFQDLNHAYEHFLQGRGGPGTGCPILAKQNVSQRRKERTPSPAVEDLAPATEITFTEQPQVSFSNR